MRKILLSKLAEILYVVHAIFDAQQVHCARCIACNTCISLLKHLSIIVVLNVLVFKIRKRPNFNLTILSFLKKAKIFKIFHKIINAYLKKFLRLRWILRFRIASRPLSFCCRCRQYDRRSSAAAITVVMRSAFVNAQICRRARENAAIRASKLRSRVRI